MTEEKEKNISREEQKEISKEVQKTAREVEAVLFYRGVETSLDYLAKHTKKPRKIVEESLQHLSQRLAGTGLVLIQSEHKFLLAVSPENTEIIKSIKGHEEYGELSKSALETLSIVLYKGPISRFEIDDIRGVNSSYSLRNLSVRGLVEAGKDDKGSNLYVPTVDTYSFLGVSSQEDLPGLEEVRKKLDAIEKETQEEENTVFNS